MKGVAPDPMSLAPSPLLGNPESIRRTKLRHIIMTVRGHGDGEFSLPSSLRSVIHRKVLTHFGDREDCEDYERALLSKDKSWLSQRCKNHPNPVARSGDR